ncbi:MAG: N-6 DNA methylase, partial [Methylococcales bacterium]
MTDQNTNVNSDSQKQIDNARLNAQHKFFVEIDLMRGQGFNAQALLKLIQQQEYDFSKDDILKIFSGRYGLWRESEFCSTPNKIAELIAGVAGIYSPESVIDICCGTGNILSYFKNISRVRGVDINSDAVHVAQLINANADILSANILKYDIGDVKYDLVIGHLPFGARTIDKKPLEIELIKKGLELLADNGVAIFIVSEGLLTNSEAAEFRHELLSSYALDMVISLPAGAFSYTFIKTSVLVLRKGQNNEDVYFPDFKDNPIEVVDNFKQLKGETYIPISKITDRLDRNHYLSLEAINELIKGYDLIKLSDVSEIIKGKALDSKRFTTSGAYLSFNRQDKNGKNFIDVISDERCVLKPDDIVVHLIGPKNKISFYEEQEIKT